MAVDVDIEGTKKWFTSGYSISESVTPLDLSSSNGGIGHFDVSGDELSRDRQLLGRSIKVSDGAQGVTSGIVDSVRATNGVTTISGQNSMVRLNVSVIANPFSGTFEQAIAYYFSLTELTENYLIDAALTSIPVVLNGWQGNLYDNVRQLCQGLQIDMSWVSENIVFRTPRTRIAQVYRDSQVDWELDDTQLAQEVACYYYQKTYKTAQAYPLMPLELGAEIYQVDADQVVVQNIDLIPRGEDGTGRGATLESIAQPTAVDDVPLEGAIGSVYAVIGKDNLLYPAGKWVDGGGSVVAKITDDRSHVEITITGPSDPTQEPYRLALPTDDTLKDFYSTLRLQGQGTFYDRQIYTIPTGNSVDRAPTQRNGIIDNNVIDTPEQAWRACQHSMASAVGPKQSIRVTSIGINTIGDPNSYTRITIQDFDNMYDTFAQFDAQFASKTFQYVDDTWFAMVAGDFENQAFGNVSGARVLNQDCYFRISDSVETEDGVQYTALADTLIQDWDTVFAGKTFKYWDDIWAGKRFIDYSPTPLGVES